MSKPELPLPEALKFLENAQRYHKTTDIEAKRVIAFDQLERFRQINPNVKVWDVLELFDSLEEILL